MASIDPGRPADTPGAAHLDGLLVLRALLLMLVRGSVNGAVAPFATILLVQAGLAPAFIGPVAAGAAIAMLVGAPAWGRLGDRHGRRRVLAAAFLVSAPIALAQATLVLPVMVASYLAWSFVGSAFVPLTDSLVLARMGGSRSRYARLRIGSSTAYMAIVIVVGAAITFSAAGWSAPGIAGVALCLLGAAVVAARLRGELVRGTGVAVHAGTGLIEGLRGGVGRHGWFLVGMSIAWAGVNAPGIFTGPRVAEVGGSGLDVGLAIAAGTLGELPSFLVLPWLLRLVGGQRLFLAGGILLGIAGVLSALAPTAVLLIAARLLFGAGFAWLVIPSLGAITSAAEPAEHAAAAALLFASSAVGSLLVAVTGLPLVALTGSVSGPLAAAALATPIGALIALRAWPVVRATRRGGPDTTRPSRPSRPAEPPEPAEPMV